MIVSWNWLTDYVRLDMTADELADRLALTGLNHEGTAEVGGDLAIDLEVTSNRPDCLGHLGIAREIAAVFGARGYREPSPNPPRSGPPAAEATGVTVDEPGLCPRFTARVVTGAKVGPSPWWMRKRLETLGVRCINNIVDVTNYVMFECGQPLHAYDLDALAGRRLVVRKATSGETLVAINGKTYELAPGMLVIADADRPVGLAGVMGGLDTEIADATTDILIEAARFDALSVRRTSRSLGLMSPSSYRFERPMDPERTYWASRRCADLILELAGGTLHEGVIDLAAEPPPERPAVMLRFSQIARVLGIEIPRVRVEAILESLGLERVWHDDHAASFRPPSWRSDLGREIDLIEEAARVYGYEHIPEDRPVPLAASSLGRRERIERAVREALTGLGLDEAVGFSLVPDELIAPLDPMPVEAPIRAEHPDFRKNSALRQSLVPSLLAARGYNEAHGVPDARLFEVAHVYLPRPGRPLPDESPRVAFVTGTDFPGIKGIVEALLDRLHPAGQLDARPASPSPMADGRSAELLLGGLHLGYAGEIDADASKRFGLRGRCAAAELSLDALIDRADLAPSYRPVPIYPSVTRDLSLVIDRAIPWSELAEAVRGSGGPTLESVEFLDTFEGAGVPEGRHSLHFGMSFRRSDRTLTGEEVEASIRRIVDACRARFDASLRAS
ncbi:phenylalanine--tRNA ligase subunit beta [Tautonia plasticadhaerens]|uniref:Phenylalanine--tRNA ligase beta subunit n=1 Tax=Tautonia plasticadhaerens TaxID=2527974 RepID=A0A518GXI3_9BACT|nr:phenylalanine--tRNA ligase subunit beta [Tautonia plasticadhaerens]QDV33300.1 Phenylalanine--tRNA ligase beta subunit [Tautonia plasticadhaerens]